MIFLKVKILYNFVCFRSIFYLSTKTREMLILCYLPNGVGDVMHTLEMANVRNTSIRSTFPLKPGTISDFRGGHKNDTG